METATPSPPAILTPEMRRAAWLLEKRSAIGGSEVAAIVLPPDKRPQWCNPLKVWADKMGFSEDNEKPWMRAGRRMERTILEMYSEARELPIEFADPYGFIRDPQLPCLGATLDARLHGLDRRPVDAKNLRFKDPADFGDAGSGVVKMVYQCQLHVQMMATGTEMADLACLFSGQDFEFFTVWRDEETNAIIREQVSAWWERHIIQGIQPDLDGSESAAALLASRWKKNTDVLIPPTPEQIAVAGELARWRALEAEATDEKKRLENILKSEIRTAAGIDGICTWKKSRDGESINYEAAYREISGAEDPVKVITEIMAKGQDAWPAFLAKFKVPKPGSRRFLFTEPGSAE